VKSTLITNAKDTPFNDYQALHRLLTEAFAYMNGVIDPPSSMLKLDQKSLREKTEKETLLIATHHKELVGCIFIQPRNDHCYAGKFAVKAEYRHQGVGTKLLRAAQEWACDQGYVQIDLETRVELIDNHRYFEKQGFSKTAENAHAGFDRPTSFVYSKVLLHSSATDHY